MTLPLGDLRVLTGGAESRRQGFDPMIENPGDPWHRRLNYPRLWQSLYPLGVTPDHTTVLGIALIFLFLTGVCLVLPNPSGGILVLVIAAILSPATLLGVERGNVDLLMFFLVSLSVVAAHRWPAVSAATVFSGFALKLFPLFACAVLLRASRSTFLRLILVLLVAATVYIVLTYSDLALIRTATQKGIVFSYGIDVFWMSLPAGNWSARMLSYLVVLLAFFWGFTALRRDDVQSERQKEPIYLDAFRAGAAIYLGTFFFGNNWDYRLIFLILPIPQLAIWAGGSERHASVSSMVVLSSMLLSLWYLEIARFTGRVMFADVPVCFLLDQLYKWAVFAGLLFLFLWSMPGWVKGSVRELNSQLSRIYANRRR